MTQHRKLIEVDPSPAVLKLPAFGFPPDIHNSLPVLADMPAIVLK